MDSTLSIERGRRLCKIKGGKLSNEVLYLLDRTKKCCDKCNKRCKGGCCDSCIQGGCCSSSDKDIIEYCSLKDNGIFQHMPNNEDKNSDVLFVNGKRGSGKSYYVSEYAEEYIKLFPKNSIFLFSHKPKDDNLDDIITKRVDMKRYVEEGGLTAEKFPDNCMVIFDDIDVLPDDKESGKLRTKIFHLMNELIQISRDRNITVVQTSHLTTNHGETKHALNGCSQFTFFYGAVSHQIKNALKTYIGLSKENIKRILDLKGSRYCTIFTTVPPVAMTAKELIILK